jgi:peptidoglycan/LPS O-acetylase OafA/YrhL
MKRPKQRKTSEQSQKRDRILVFDIIRIFCVAIIVYVHSQFFLIPEINKFLFPDGFGPFNIYPAGLDGYAVYGIILISGAVLEYNYQGIEKLHGYLQFLFRRVVRIYPAFWMSLILGIILTPALLWQINPATLLFEFTGFFVALGQGNGNINVMGWFVAAIMSLYFLFPWFSKIMRKYGLAALIGFCAMSWGLRFLILTFDIVPIANFWRWFPLCNAFEFCLGIYIIQTGFYPKTVNTSPVILGLADVSYYVFLFNVLIIQFFNPNWPNWLLHLDAALAFNNIPVYGSMYYFQVMGILLVVAWIVMKIDDRIRSWIMRQDRVKKFLTTKQSKF